MRQFADVLHCVLAKVLAESHVYLVGRLNEVEYLLLALYAKAPRIARQVVELFSGGAGVHLHKVVVELLHGFVGQPRILFHTAHVLCHVGVLVHIFGHGLLEGAEFARDAVERNCCSLPLHPPLIYKVPVACRLLLVLYLLEFLVGGLQ